MTMTTFSLMIQGLPVPQGSKGVSKKGRMFEANKNTKPWRAKVTELAEQEVAMMDGWVTLDCPVHVVLRFYLPRPGSHYGTGRNADVLKPDAPRLHATKPDLDKLARAINDSLTKAGVWVDDSRAATMQLEKFYCHAGGEGVQIILRPTT